MTYAATVRPEWQRYAIILRAFAWLAVVMILMWLLVSLWARGQVGARRKPCNHGASSIVMTNGKVSKPHRTGCLP